MVLLEASLDVPDDEPSEVQRLWKTLVKLLELLEADGALLELEPNACARLENVDAMFLYCCTCCDALGCCGRVASGVLFFAVASSVPLAAVAAVMAAGAALGVEVNPSCASAAATAEASRLAFWVDAPVEAIDAADSLNSLL
ncbi:hypothetical protein GCM10010872_20400 [Dyella flava]|nr:hypothetical protein GCM10010872_20400 [Dyella flava]